MLKHFVKFSSMRLLLHIVSVAFAAAENITIGYLMIGEGTPIMLRLNTQGDIISGAISLAIAEINNDQEILPRHKLQLLWANTLRNTSVAVMQMKEQKRSGAVAFFGPEDHCKTEASLAAYWDLPMIAYKCPDPEVSNKQLYPTFVRTSPPPSQVANSIIVLLKKFNWWKITMVVGSTHQWQSVAKELEEEARVQGISINARFEYAEPHFSLPDSPDDTFSNIVAKSHNISRIYVSLGGHDGMVAMMHVMQENGLLATGEYILIHVDLHSYDITDPLKYFASKIEPIDTVRNMEAARSLLVIVASPPSNPNYDRFHALVNDYNEKPPFNIYSHPMGLRRQITVYAAYLYDAVYLYAKALHELIEETKPNITSAAHMGSRIIRKIRGRSYTSIQGFKTRIDENGDSEGNFTLLARLPMKSKYASHSMVPVGHFELQDHMSLPTLRMLQGREIKWMNGKPPADEPKCGYSGKKCTSPTPNTSAMSMFSKDGSHSKVNWICMVFVQLLMRKCRTVT